MRAVFFDLDGTLLHFTRDYREILADAFRDAVGGVERDDLEAYNEAFFALLHGLEPSPVARAVQAVRPDADPDTFADALIEREIEATEPPTDAAADLRRLGEQFRLGVLTNGVGDWQRRKLRAHGLDGYFEAFVASYESGAHKPDPAPFRLAEQRLPADAYAMVGDDDADVHGANDAGWTAFRYDGDGFGELPDALPWDE